jgi:hypothetical protein
MIQNQNIDKEQGHEISSEFGIGSDYRRGMACDACLGESLFFHHR